MRASALQYLYLQKPVTTIIVLCLVTILPWIATGDFSTKGEPREADAHRISVGNDPHSAATSEAV